jgi:homogentisate 1,2-dioxygenase
LGHEDTCHYLSRGSVPKKRHTRHRADPGFKGEGLFYEEVVTTQGFSRAYSIAYHLRPPTRVKAVEPAGSMPVEVAPQDVLRHHHLKSAALPSGGDPVTGRVPLLTNADVTLWRCKPTQPQAELFRNALADEVIFVHKGTGGCSRRSGCCRSGRSTTSSSRAAPPTSSTSRRVRRRIYW